MINVAHIRILPSALAIIMVFNFALPVMASDTVEANRLFVSAVTTWEKAAMLSEEELHTIELRVGLLEEVFGNLQSIVNDHPGADLAVRLIIGDQVGPLSLGSVEAALKEAHETQATLSCIRSPSRTCILKKARSAASNIDEHQWRAVTLAKIAGAGQDEEVFANALSIAQRITHPLEKNNALWAIASEYVSVSRFSKALAVGVEISNAEQRADIFHKVAIEQSNYGYFDDAWASALKIEDAVPRSYAMLEVAIQQNNTSLLAEALLTARRIVNSRNRAMALQRIAKAQSNATLFQEALQAVDEIPSARVRAQFISSIVIDQIESGLVHDALETSRTRGEKGLLVTALVEAATVLEDPNYLTEALFNARRIKEPSTRALKIKDIALRKADPKVFSEVLLIADEIEHARQRSQILSEIAIALARDGQVSAALSTIRRIPRWGVFRADALLEIVRVQINSGLFEAAFLTTSRIEDRGRLIRALLDISLRQADSGKYIDAFATIRRIDEPPFRAIGYRDIVYSQAKAGKVLDALSNAIRIEDARRRSEALVAIAGTLSE